MNFYLQKNAFFSISGSQAYTKNTGACHFLHEIKRLNFATVNALSIANIFATLQVEMLFFYYLAV